MGKFVLAVSQGLAREIAVFGTRGDGKTIGALGAMPLHAQEHERHGFPLPVPWMGVTDTYQSHKLKTIRSLQDPLWDGCWRLSDQNHVATFVLDRKPLVTLDLFGIEDQGAMDRMRMETVGLWVDEPAPSAVMITSSGVSDTAWGIGITSQRKPSHCHPAILTGNYPDEDYWTWTRFKPGAGISGITPGDPSKLWFRIPPGERATEKDRAQWAHALKDRPDILQRLISGLPGAVILGQQVATGFNENLHVSKDKLYPIKGEPLCFGQDGGHTPATIIGQAWRGYIFIYAALPIERGGMRQQYEQNVIPWLRNNAPWALDNRITDKKFIYGGYDPSMPDDESDSDKNPITLIEELVGGSWMPGPQSWEARKGSLLAMMLRKAPTSFSPALQIDPVDGRPLIQALSTRWHYPQNRLGVISADKPKTPNHPWEDLGQAFCYFLSAAMPDLVTQYKPRQKEEDVEDFNVFDFFGGNRKPAVGAWR